MSLSAAVLDALAASGVSREQIIAAVKADIAEREAEDAARREAKKQGNRERQQRKRAKSNAPSRDVTRVTRDSRDKGSNDRDILTSKGFPPKPNGLDPKPKKHRLPADWQPLPFTLGTMAAQVVDRWEPGRIERELAKFRDHHAAAGTRWENWQAAWSKWVNNSGDFERGRSGTGTGGKSATAFAMLSPGEEPF